MITYGWSHIQATADALVTRWADKTALTDVAGVTEVYGIPRGGCIPAALIASRLKLPLVDCPRPGATLVIDDLVDGGKTARHYTEQGMAFDALYRKYWSPSELAPDAWNVGSDWIAFPWESKDGPAGPEDAVVRLLEFIGEDPNREGLLDTPQRVVKALSEMTEGYGLDAGVILGRTFEESCDDMIVVRQVPFTSLCEHHLLPFTGTATVGYIPAESGGVVGLSKLARLVELHARKLQVQERMTAAIAADIQTHLDAFGVGVVVRAFHSCMAVRGVRKSAEMVTSTMLGAMRDDARARAEFLDLSR